MVTDGYDSGFWNARRANPITLSMFLFLMNSEEKTVLLVEDDTNDVFFLQYTFECV
jgi:hypothetical protein